MDIKLRIFIGVVLVIGFLYVIHSIRKKKIDIRHSLVWILVCVLLAILDIWPSLLNNLARILGFELPVNMLFFLGFAIAVVIIFGLTTRVSRQSEQIKSLAQEIALLKEKAEGRADEEKTKEL
ncbi:MAG: DUF2304 domain-containing protein [Lachnospiraceae bacterium]|nr:DUF2304 domain-containing protein [Lachnospiraceae bacterium]